MNNRSIITLVTLAAIIACLGCFGCTKSATKWEYSTLKFEQAVAYERIDTGSEKAATINFSQALLDAKGHEGWELVTSYLEMETAFPNFAKGDTVAGLKSNIRPQRLVLIFKRPQ